MKGSGDISCGLSWLSLLGVVSWWWPPDEINVPLSQECVPTELPVDQGIWAFWFISQRTGYFPARVPWIQELELNRMGTSLSEVSRGVIKQIGGISTPLPPSKNEGSTVTPPVCGSRPRPVWDWRSRQVKYAHFSSFSLFYSCFLSYVNPVTVANAGYKFAHPKVVRPLWFQCNSFFCSITSSRKVLTVVSSQLARSMDICCHVYIIGYDERITGTNKQ